MFQEAMIAVPKLTPEQGLKELLLDYLLILGVVVKGLKVVEGARELIQELPKKGGSTSVGGRNKDVPDLATLLCHNCIAQMDGGEIQIFSQLIT